MITRLRAQLMRKCSMLLVGRRLVIYLSRSFEAVDESAFAAACSGAFVNNLME